MRVAAGIDEQVTEQTIRQPRRCIAERLDVAVQLLESHFKFVKRIIPRFVDTRRLACWPDKQAAEQPAQRWMILPVCEQRAQQIRSAQNRRILGSTAADNDVIATACAGVPAIN